MLADSRASLREIFLLASRKPEVHFYTSNIDKYLQARLVFEKCGLTLQHFKTSKEPYNEDYTLGKEALLTRAITEVRGIVGSGSIFFVEDTSIRIDALSEGSEDYPGLSAKEWFSDTTFESLDLELRKRGTNRRAVVKSDIALYIPGLRKPVFFHGETTGKVADSAPSFSRSISHPWLTPSTFNGWIIPDGAVKRLGEMEFEESWKYDFRVEALVKLLERLEEYTAALNLPISSYTRRASTGPTSQLSLLETRRSILVVVGRTCAGKTAMCERLSSKHGFTVFEASSVLRTFPRSPSSPALSEQAFAKQVLNEFGSDAVARKISELLDGTMVERLAISGFRTIEELEFTRDNFPETRVVFVEASDRTRYERRIRRARAGDSMTFEDFNALDQEQWQFGLLRVAEELADVRVINESSIAENYDKIALISTGEGGPQTQGISTMLRPSHDHDANQLVRCLESLEQAARPLDCGEIERATSLAGHPVRHNNANKVLKSAPELATRLEMPGTRIRYRISDAGRAYLRVLRQREINVAKP